jgi:tetratricopeptide (TPR) repeat protein
MKTDRRAAYSKILQLLKQQQEPAALDLCKKLVTKAPDFADGWLLLCQIQLKRNRPDRALDCVEQVVKREPDNVQAAILHTECLIAAGQKNTAAKKLAGLEVKVGDDVSLLCAVANLHNALESYDDACRCLQRAIDLDKDNLNAWHLYSGVLFAQGRLPEAEVALAEVLRLAPAHSEALLTQSLMRRQTTQSNHVSELENALESSRLKGPDRVRSCYALAKELEDLERYPEAFQWLKQGADENDALLNYSVTADLAFMDHMSNSAKFADAGDVSDKTRGEGLLFIVSLPRAGSTLVDRILASHTDVESMGETAAFYKALVQCARKVDLGRPVSFLEALEHTDYADVAAIYLASLDISPDESKTLIDKTPSNHLYPGLIQRAFPAAKIIHVRKNPMDACYSVYRTYFGQGFGYSYDLDKLAQYYIGYHQSMLFWQQRLSASMLTVQYEDLVQTQESQTRRLLKFLGISWQEACMEFHNNSSPTATASVVQVRQPLFSSSLDRWRCYEQELTPLYKQLSAAGIEVSNG